MSPLTTPLVQGSELAPNHQLLSARPRGREREREKIDHLSNRGITGVAIAIAAVAAAVRAESIAVAYIGAMYRLLLMFNLHRLGWHVTFTKKWPLFFTLQEAEKCKVPLL